MNNAAPAAHKGHLRRSENRQPFALKFKTQVPGGVEPDAGPKSERESRETHTGAVENTRPANASQHVGSNPDRPLFDPGFVTKVAVELIEDDTLALNRGVYFLAVYVRILASPAHFDQILLPWAAAKSNAVARAGFQHDAGVGSSDVRVDRKSHTGTLSDEEGHVKAKRLRLGRLLSGKAARKHQEKCRDEKQHPACFHH